VRASLLRGEGRFSTGEGEEGSALLSTGHLHVMLKGTVFINFTVVVLKSTEVVVKLKAVAAVRINRKKAAKGSSAATRSNFEFNPYQMCAGSFFFI